MIMRKVKIAEFKSKLSAHLKKVRQGEEIIVLHRDEAIAKVIPIRKKEKLSIRKPLVQGKFADVKFTPPKLRKKINILKMLREDRDAR